MEQEIVFVHSAKANRVTVEFISVEHVEKADATGIQCTRPGAIPTPESKDDSESFVVSFGGVGIVVIGIGVGIVVIGIVVPGIGQQTKL